jgi:hypothetical protein
LTFESLTLKSNVSYCSQKVNGRPKTGIRFLAIFETETHFLKQASDSLVFLGSAALVLDTRSEHGDSHSEL